MHERDRQTDRQTDRQLYHRTVTAIVIDKIASCQRSRLKLNQLRFHIETLGDYSDIESYK